MAKLPISPFELNIVKEELNKCQREKLARGKQLGEVMSTSGSFTAKTPGYSETENVIRVIDAKIAQFNNILNETSPIKRLEELPEDRISVYSMIIAEDENGELKKYYICHFPSANHSNDEYLSVTPRSPVGKTLLGRKCGDMINLQLPRGTVELTIIGHERII